MAITPEEDLAPFEDLPATEDKVAVRVITLEEERAQFDARARELMRISGEEFLRRLDAGEYDEIYDRSSQPHGLDVVYLDMMRPGGR
jgi:hypothetical protein